MQITARSDRDLTPEGIIQKISDGSGSKYSGAPSNPSSSHSPPPQVSSKPAFTPTRSSGGSGGYNPLAQARVAPKNDPNVDEDGWGKDAPPVTRTQLEKVQSSYQQTKVNIRELSSQKPEVSRFNGSHNDSADELSDVVKGGYQPIGKVDIEALRRQAKETGGANEDRPTVVKGSYEPVGKVDIAAIRARAQKPTDDSSSSISPTVTGAKTLSSRRDEESLLGNRSMPFSTSERLKSLPKPRVSKRFGSSASTFTGTVAPTPQGFDSGSSKAPTPPLGVGRTFADKGGKTPAQLWAEKKARERGVSGGQGSEPAVSGGSGPSITSQASGSGEWKSGYGGKSWAPVQTARTGQSSGSLDRQNTGEEDKHEDAPTSPVVGVSAIRDRFKNVPPIGAGNVGSNRRAPSPPPLDTSNKPNASRGVPIPILPGRPQAHLGQDEDREEEEREVPRLPSPPPQPPRSPTPPTPPTPPALDTGSPIRIVKPVGRGATQQVSHVADAREEQFSPPPAMPTRSLAQAIPDEVDLTEEPLGHDPARAAGQAVAAATFGHEAEGDAQPALHDGGSRAVVQYDYEKNEDNEVDLVEGDYVTNIDMVDEHWWMGTNKHGETGLFPSNYVELVEGERHAAQHEPERQHDSHGHKAEGSSEVEQAQGYTATAIYDYEAAEDNELSFPEDAKITDVVSPLADSRILAFCLSSHLYLRLLTLSCVCNQGFPDDDWWSGTCGGKSGLFPSAYVRLDE